MKSQTWNRTLSVPCWNFCIQVSLIEKHVPTITFTDKIQLNDVNTPPLLEAACKYDVEGLKLACLEFAMVNLGVNSVLEYLRIGSTFKLQELCNKSFSYIDEHIEEIFLGSKETRYEEQNCDFRMILTCTFVQIQCCLSFQRTFLEYTPARLSQL